MRDALIAVGTVAAAILLVSLAIDLGPGAGWENVHAWFADPEVLLYLTWLQVFMLLAAWCLGFAADLVTDATQHRIAQLGIFSYFAASAVSAITLSERPDWVTTALRLAFLVFPALLLVARLRMARWSLLRCLQRHLGRKGGSTA